MLYAVIDIGSNSVRLMLNDGEKTLIKKVKITRLSEGMTDAKVLTDDAIIRTAQVVADFVGYAKKENVDKIFAFATAAVRYAKNSAVFLSEVRELCGIEIDVVSGTVEAELGYKGALNGLDGGVIDIGGASSEILVVKNNEIIYERSLDVGVVKIKDVCGQDEKNVFGFCRKKIKEFGDIPTSNFVGIGGTATSIASMMLELEPYNPEKINGYIIYKKQLKQLTKKLFSMSIEERRLLKGLQSERAEVIAGGCALLYLLMEKLSVDNVTVSESDNLEGYLMLKTEKYE